MKRNGTYKKAIPEKKNNIKEKPKKKDERKFTSPEWDWYPPKSLKKLCVSEYPTCDESRIFPPG